MSTSERLFAQAERATDLMNPILVKETRQAFKSRQFIVTFFLLLVVAWLISAAGALWAGPALEYGTAGRQFFIFYFFVLAFAILFVVPFGAFRSMLNEKEHNTYELLSISTLTPRQIVWGKMCSALVQIFIYYSAIAPFMAFTSLLQGFDLALVALYLVGALLWAICVSMVSIMLSTLSSQRQWQAMNTLAMVVLLFWQFGMIFPISAFGMAETVPFDDPDFWWTVASLVIGGASYFVLSMQIAVSRLTFESDNRSTRIRIICSIQFWGVWGFQYFYHRWNGAGSVDEEVVAVLAGISLFHWTVVGLFAGTESEFLSRRVRRALPGSAALRWLIMPWIPGGTRGMVFLLGHLLALSAIIYLGDWPVWMNWVHAAVLYVICFLGFGAFVGRLAHRVTPEFRPAHARVLTVLIAAFAMVAPYLVSVIGLTRPIKHDSLMVISNPFATLPLVSDFGDSDLTRLILTILGGAAVLAVLLNARAMLKGVFAVSPYRPPVRPDVSDETQLATTATEGQQTIP